MSKLEILKMAFEKAKTPRDAMALAHEMAQFIENERKPLLLTTGNSRNGSPWRDEEIAELKKLHANNVPENEIATVLNRNQHAIRVAIYKIKSNHPIGRTKK